jgi:signal transduction histidine kinase
MIGNVTGSTAAPGLESNKPIAPSAPARGPLATALVVATLILLATTFAAIRIIRPSDFTSTAAFTPYPDGVHITALRPGQTGLREDDIVVAVNGVSLGSRVLPKVEVGDHVVYQVRRGERLIDVPLTIGKYPLATALARHWATLVLLGSLLAVSVYVFARRPNDRAARVLAVVAALGTCGATSWIFGHQVIDLGGGPAWWANLGGGVAYALVWAAMLHFALVFPEPPNLLRRNPRLVGWVYALPVLLYAVHTAVALPGASTELQRAGVLASTTTWIEYVIPPLLAGAVIAGYCRTDRTTRRKLRSVTGWIALSIALEIVLWQLPIAVLGHPLIYKTLHPLVFLPAPLAIAAAVLRRRLFDIDVVVRRYLLFVALTAGVTALYLVAVGLGAQGFDDWEGWPRVLGVGLVAVAIAPLYQRARKAVARSIYGQRDDPFGVIAELGKRLEEIPSPDDVLPQVVDTLGRTLRLPYVAIELTYADGVDQAVSYGQTQGALLSLPLEVRGERLGRLLVAERTPGESFSRSESRLLGDLARQAGVAAHAVRLTRDLQRSRERLVSAREEERRRLRRDLHDGLAPALAGVALELQAVRRLARTDPEAAEDLALRVADEVKGAVKDIRNLVEDLRPAALDQLGLVSALREQARSLAMSDGEGSFVVTVDAEGEFTDLPAAVEVAAFRIACEALNNASRHSEATACSLRLKLDRFLELEVADNGRGVPPDHRAGVGLGSMQERAEELGGSCKVESGTTGGTVVRACLPLAPR